MEEKELVRSAISGNQEAFAALVEIYRIKMFNLAYSITRNRETADDIAQDVFIKAYLALPRFKFKSEFGTWLYRIAINTIKDQMRKQSRMKTTPYEENISYTPIQEDETVKKEIQSETDQKRKLVYTTLNSLPEKHRLILTLRDIQEYSYKDITNILKISPGTVDSRLHRARKLLRNKVVNLLAKAGGQNEM